MKKVFFLFVLISSIMRAQELIEPIHVDTLSCESPIYFPKEDIVFKIGVNAFVDVPVSLNEILKRQPDGNLLVSVPNFFNSVDERVDFRNETRIRLFDFGYKFGPARNNFISVSNEVVSDFELDFNRDFLDYLIRGNSKYVGQKIGQHRDDGMGLLLYNSLALSYARKIKSKLIVELRAKYLIGLMNINFEKFNINLYTSNPTIDESFYTQMKYDVLVNTSGLSGNSLNQFDKNTGLAFDLGIEYKYSKKLTLATAIKDVGKIDWDRGNNLSLVQDSIIFIESLIDGESLDEDLSDQLESTMDSLSDIMKMDSIQTNYSTNLPRHLYFGAIYSLTEKASISTFLHNRSIGGASYNSLYIQYQQRWKPWLRSHVYYSVINGTYSNIGLGCTFETKNIDFYIATNNLRAIDLMSAEQLGVQFSLRFKFYRPKKVNEKKFSNYKRRF